MRKIEITVLATGGSMDTDRRTVQYDVDNALSDHAASVCMEGVLMMMDSKDALHQPGPYRPPVVLSTE